MYNENLVAAVSKANRLTKIGAKCNLKTKQKVDCSILELSVCRWFKSFKFYIFPDITQLHLASTFPV